MHLAFDIFQGMGIAAAVGIRPFLPALLAGALAAGSVEIHFNGTDYSYLQSVPFLLAMAVAAVVLGVIETRRDGGRVDRRPVVVAIALIGAALGAMFFAGSLARGHFANWPGVIGGVVCAAVAVFASRPLLVRTRARLDESASRTLPLYAEGIGGLVAILSIVAPPLGLIAVLALLWLLIAGRRRRDEKYAGLRILR